MHQKVLPIFWQLLPKCCMDIFSECTGSDLPAYVRPLTLEDYFSEKVTGRYVMETIRNAWQTSRSSFEISERANELRYNAGATWEADRILKELPETLEPHKSSRLDRYKSGGSTGVF